MNINPTDYPYKYETHMHTNQGSDCGHFSGAEMSMAYKAAGYAGIIITDHHFGGNTHPDRSLPWESWVDEFCMGYEDAAACGKEIGIDVFFGWESGFKGTEFLIYGPDKQWMKQHPELKTCTVEQQYSLIHSAGGMVIHAHPFRERFYIKAIRLYPDYVDGVEAYNSGNLDSDNPDTANQKAFAYTAEHDFPATAGSDMHTTTLTGAGVCFKKRLESIDDFIKIILSKKDYILTDGKVYYKLDGSVIS